MANTEVGSSTAPPIMKAMLLWTAMTNGCKSSILSISPLTSRSCTLSLDSREYQKMELVSEKVRPNVKAISWKPFEILSDRVYGLY